MRYVVRNNFFGLESRAQLLEGIRAGEHEGRRGKPAEEDVGAVSQFAPLASGERDSAQSSTAVSKACTKQDVGTSKADVVDQDLPQNHHEQSLMTDQVCSQQSSDPPMDLTASAEQAAEDFLQNAEEMTPKDCYDIDLPVTENITPAFTVYDDEIWESPGGIL